MRQAFQDAVDHALLKCRGAKQRAIYVVFDQFGWNLEDDEVAYAAQQAGFKQGWSYFHTGARRQQSRETWEQQKEDEAQELLRREQTKARARQHAQEQMESEYRQRQQDKAAEKAFLDSLYGAYRNQRASEAEQRARAQAQAQQAQQETLDDHLRSQLDWLFRAAMMQGVPRDPVGANGCPRHLEAVVQRFGLKWPYTAVELKKAFRVKAMETHPDRQGGSEEAFKQVQKDNQELESYAQG